MVVWSPPPTVTPDVLILDAHPDLIAPILRRNHRVCGTSHPDAAIELLRRSSPEVILADIDIAGGLDVCRAAQSKPQRPVVIVTTGEATLVPDALNVGCDSVLLKPFAPNLLVFRMSRLLRERSEALRAQASIATAKADHLLERSSLVLSGTNRIWPTQSCPYCSHRGVTSFDHASQRRTWFACLACRKVWIAKLLVG